MPSRDIGAGLLARDIAEPGRQTVERAGELVHARRGLHHLLRADRVEKRLEPGDGDAQLAFQPAVALSDKAAAADRDGLALLHARLRDVDASAGRLQLRGNAPARAWAKNRSARAAPR